MAVTMGSEVIQRLNTD